MKKDYPFYYRVCGREPITTVGLVWSVKRSRKKLIVQNMGSSLEITPRGAMFITFLYHKTVVGVVFDEALREALGTMEIRADTVGFYWTGSVNVNLKLTYLMKNILIVHL